MIKFLRQREKMVIWNLNKFFIILGLIIFVIQYWNNTISFLDSIVSFASYDVWIIILIEVIIKFIIFYIITEKFIDSLFSALPLLIGPYYSYLRSKKP